MFTSDHGEINGSQGHDRKMRPWDESILVPFLLHLPDGTGRQIEAPFGIPDIMPTLLDLVGVPVPDEVEGMSFANHMLGQHLLRLHSLGATFRLPITLMNMVAGNIRTFELAVILMCATWRSPGCCMTIRKMPISWKICATNQKGVLSDLLEKQSDTFATSRELLDRWGYEMVNPHAFRRIRTGK